MHILLIILVVFLGLVMLSHEPDPNKLPRFYRRKLPKSYADGEYLSMCDRARAKGFWARWD